MNRLTDDLFGGPPRLRTVPVLVPMPAPRPYSYSVPEGMAVEPGSIVQVPLGSRLVAGVVWERLGEDDVDPKKLRPIEKYAASLSGVQPMKSPPTFVRRQVGIDEEAAADTVGAAPATGGTVIM